MFSLHRQNALIQSKVDPPLLPRLPLPADAPVDADLPGLTEAGSRSALESPMPVSAIGKLLAEMKKPAVVRVSVVSRLAIAAMRIGGTKSVETKPKGVTEKLVRV